MVLDPLKWLSFCEILNSSGAVGREWMKLAVGLLPRPPPPPSPGFAGREHSDGQYAFPGTLSAFTFNRNLSPKLILKILNS